MVLALIALAAMAAPPATAANTDEAKLAKLSAARGAFVKQYRSPKKERLQVTENLGTTGAGNPFREWYFPAGSVSYQIWIVTYQGYEGSDAHGRTYHVPRSGALVYKSRHGKYTTTDWVLNLADGKDRHPSGTVAKLLAESSLKVKGKLTKAQAKLIAGKHPYVGFTEFRSPVSNGHFTWYVSEKGQASKDTYFMDQPSNHDVWMLFAPPIVPEEAQYMGIKRTEVWHGKADYTIQKNPDLG